MIFNGYMEYFSKRWHSSYPVDWAIEIPALNAACQVHPLFDEQSLYDFMAPDYWEGLCAVEGTLRGKPVTGSAYVELTGYESGSLLF